MTMAPGNRQTISFLRRRFEDAGLQPDSRHGQNFLIDLNLLGLLVDAASLQSDDLVLEVGTGTGALTAMLAERAGYVITVEIDERLHQLASEELQGRANVELLHQDVLRNKNSIHANVLQRIAEVMSELGLAHLKLVANLPYNIATPLVSNLLSTPIVPQRMVVTIQKELADRMVARPGTKDYGALSVWIQSLCDAEILRVLPPSVFWPRPKVDSAFISIRPRPEKRERIPDLPGYHTFVRSLFLHRRKFLRSNLISALKPELEKSDVDQIMNARGLTETSRSEQLDTEQFLQLYRCVRERLTIARADSA